MRTMITAPMDEQNELIKKLEQEDSTNARRILKLLHMPDLTEVENHPIKLMKDRIVSLPRYKEFDIITIPEIVSTEIMFDTYNFPKDHPARSESDTYYVDADHVLRPHTSIMWWYYLETPGIREKLEKKWSVGIISYGKVYRKDEIDKSHHTVFHNIDAIYIAKKSKEQIGRETLEGVLNELAEAIYKDTYERMILEDFNPYTDPTLEVEVQYQWKWLELLGSGVLRPELLTLLNLDPEEYNAWAWWPGLERLVMPKMQIPDIRIFRSEDERITNQRWDLEKTYQDVSKYPSTYRDISFLIPASTHLNNYYTLIRDIAGDMVEEVQLLDKYENAEKFWADKISYTFRIVYRSHDRTLMNDEVNTLQEEIRKETVEQLGAELR